MKHVCSLLQLSFSFFLLSPTWALTGPRGTCLPLSECEAIFHLVKNKDSIPGMNRAEVFGRVRELLCGFENRMPKVLCNTPDEDHDDYEDYDNDDYYHDDEVGEEVSEEVGDKFGVQGHHRKEHRPMVARQGGVVDMLGHGQVCQGVLRLQHLGAEGRDPRTLILRRTKYPRLRRLQNRLVFHSQVEGSCCWRLSSTARFGGRQEALLLGQHGLPALQPRSAQKIRCAFD